MKLIERERVITLRRQGYSLNEISEMVVVAKSTVSLWVRNLSLSEESKKLLSNKQIEARKRAVESHKKHVDRKFTEAYQYGHEVVRQAKISPHTAQLLCAVMYWCEGTKIRRRQLLGFTNSDPKLMRAFLSLLRQGFDIDETKLRLKVHLHDYHDEKTQLQFWSKLTSIPLSQCNRPYRKKHTSVRTREGYQGCAHVTYMDVSLGRKLEGIAKAYLDRVHS